MTGVLNWLLRRLLLVLTLLTIRRERQSVASGTGVLKVDISYMHILGYGYSVFGRLAIRGEYFWVIVDTGSPNIFFVWKEWYESDFGSCSYFRFGCYTCPKTCNPSEHKQDFINFADGTVVCVFDYNDTISIGQEDVPNLHFGLVSGQDPRHRLKKPFNLLGLSPYVKGDFNSLLDQLMSSSTKPIAAKVFGLYLVERKDSISGKLLLGGGDPGIYKGPLRYVKLNSKDDYTVTVAAKIQVGVDLLDLGIICDALLDTGANSIRVPQAEGCFQRLIKGIQQEASRASIDVPFTWDAEAGLWTFPCAYHATMPRLTFWLGSKGDVPLTLTYTNYVRNIGNSCALIIRQTKKTRWTLPGEAIIGNYVEFRPEEGRVGIAPLAV
ncbi:hypothetical protein FOL47_010593 [Perkinsus chesapeaki]|uniref:Peptidase A1 domain-containing protein n=1 Tax=Perkinsus chesapeaki TaxID=330153 RepID=A0A7J6L2E5_PERCH|nr:hypothetical protein FOL47_010593 [Perkinsus chesapeaki]